MLMQDLRLKKGFTTAFDTINFIFCLCTVIVLNAMTMLNGGMTQFYFLVGVEVVCLVGYFLALRKIFIQNTNQKN